MEPPAEKFQVIFINPGLTGTMAAWQVKRAGADTAIINEKTTPRTGFRSPPGFPSGGTFFPDDVNLIIGDSGLTTPSWDSITSLRVDIPEIAIEFDSADGPGGLLIGLTDNFPYESEFLLKWLQEQLEKTGELMKNDDPRGLFSLRTVTRSISDAIRNGEFRNPDSISMLFDSLAILVLGRSSLEVDISDLPILFAGLLNGWHTPSIEDDNICGILTGKLEIPGIRIIDVGSIESIKPADNSGSIINSDDGTRFRSDILVVPEGGRFADPVPSGPGSVLQSVSWYGTIKNGLDTCRTTGAIRPDSTRPPVNDNFITYYINPENNEISISAPIETRYFDTNNERYENITARVMQIVRRRLALGIEPAQDLSPLTEKEKVRLPGKIKKIVYSENPLWGDNILSQLNTSDTLSIKILNGIN